MLMWFIQNICWLLFWMKPQRLKSHFRKFPEFLSINPVCEMFLLYLWTSFKKIDLFLRMRSHSTQMCCIFLRLFTLKSWTKIFEQIMIFFCLYFCRKKKWKRLVSLVIFTLWLSIDFKNNQPNDQLTTEWYAQ